MWKFKQTNKKAKNRKITFKNAHVTETKNLFLRETEQFLALVNERTIRKHIGQGEIKCIEKRFMHANLP